jgi:hypothetical protein
MSNSSLDIILCGSNLFGFAAGINPQHRADLLNSNLLAQAVSDKAVPIRSQSWQTHYLQNLTRLQWRLVDTQKTSFKPPRVGDTLLDQRITEELVRVTPAAHQHSVMKLIEELFKTVASLPAGSTFAQALARQMMHLNTTKPDPDESDGATLDPDESDGATLDPDESDGATLDPDESDGATLDPDESDGATLDPDESDGATPDEAVQAQTSDPISFKMLPLAFFAPPPAAKVEPPAQPSSTHLSLTFNLVLSPFSLHAYTVELNTAQNPATLGLHRPLLGKSLRGSVHTTYFTAILAEGYAKMRQGVIAKLKERIETDIILLDPATRR